MSEDTGPELSGQEAAFLKAYPEAASQLTIAETYTLYDAFKAGWEAKGSQHRDAVSDAVASFPPNTFTVQVVRAMQEGEVFCRLRAPGALSAGDSIRVALPRCAVQTENGEGLATVEFA